MAEIRMLDPHDALPDSDGRHVIVLRQFHEDQPSETVIQILLSHGPGADEQIAPLHADGTKLRFHEAIEAGRALADSEGVPTVYAIDRTGGPREREVLAAHGDHTVGMDKLSDFDTEEGVAGTALDDDRRAPAADWRADHEV